jgi:hypothetical protein
LVPPSETERGWEKFVGAGETPDMSIMRDALVSQVAWFSTCPQLASVRQFES